MTMQDIVTNAPKYVDLFCQIFVAICILATIVARMTPSPKDDELLASIESKFFKVLGWLPTLGVNPRTKQLEAALKDMQDVTPVTPVVETKSA